MVGVDLEDRPGPVKFGVRFTRMSKLSKNTDWVYNYKYKKLYVDLNLWVSVLFNLEDVTRWRTGFQVRVTAVVSDDSTFSTSSYLPFHLIRLKGASLASYQQDSQGRHSVIFPISSSAPTCRNIQFTRLSSDLGKEVKVVFSLEDGEGELVGRRVFSVKIRGRKYSTSGLTVSEDSQSQRKNTTMAVRGEVSPHHREDSSEDEEDEDERIFPEEFFSSDLSEDEEKRSEEGRPSYQQQSSPEAETREEDLAAPPVSEPGGQVETGLCSRQEAEELR